MILAAGLVWSLDHIAETTPELQLATLLLLWLLWVLILWRGLPSPFGEGRRSRRHYLRETLLSIGPALLATIDVLILFSLFSPRTVTGYLVLRAGGLAVTRAMHPVKVAAQARLRAAAVNGNTPSFVVNAARLNLGLLLIGGGICVGILALFSVLTPLFPPPFEAEKAVLSWLLLGAAAPALFGAGPLFLTITGQRREWALMSLTGAFLMAGLAYGLRVQTPLALAQLYAALQLVTFGTAAAVIGQRRGVWPGLTALLFRRIRLL
ncbi:hypothetical protein [Sulfitobacter sp. PS-8MA]|uniref:hypothetical protein n=1 Tax=Sulfitobacter sp. PS-8MA TaxID=3237707 RepID=UPI0034C5FD7F